MIMPTIETSTDNTAATIDRRSPGRILVGELYAYGAHPGRKFPVAGSDWEQAEWDRLGELAAGAH